jgi:NTE family protein
MAPKLTTDQFINNDAVIQCLEELKAAFPAGGKSFVVSDVIDDEGHQYVNLVQKGGGVLGVALVAYTYILEQMGVRFIRLAGTSAGAINTALMVAAGTKQEAKSIKVLDAICKLEFIKLVDGHPAARWLISKFITHADFTKRIKSWARTIIGTLIMLLVGNFVFLGLQHGLPWISVFTKIFFVLTGLCVLLIAGIVVYFSTLLKRLKNSGFGINPGDFFYDWIKQQLIDNGVSTVTDLNNKASSNNSLVPGLHLRNDNPEGLKGLEGDVTFITSDLVSQNKIQFPEMWPLFRKNIDDLQPAGFIRASMSIPVFFESYFINNIPCKDDDIKKLWMDKFGESDPPSIARFVDGGILSNFPINLFYNPKVLTPRLPSFGIDLDDSVPGDKGKHAQDWSPLGYFGRIFNTIRFYYDKDFLIKNKVFKKGIGTIHLNGYNWLNFFLTDQDKINMFVKGAQAAKDFLLNFDWYDYKEDRDKMRKELLKQQLPTTIIPKN